MKSALLCLAIIYTVAVLGVLLMFLDSRNFEEGEDEMPTIEQATTSGAAMTRNQAIANIKVNAAKGDIKACTRILLEVRISRAVYDQAVADGRALGAFIAKRDAAGIAA